MPGGGSAHSTGVILFIGRHVASKQDKKNKAA